MGRMSRLFSERLRKYTTMPQLFDVGTRSECEGEEEEEEGGFGGVNLCVDVEKRVSSWFAGATRDACVTH